MKTLHNMQYNVWVQEIVLAINLATAVIFTWTLLSADVKTLDAFHMKCQRQILDI